MSSISYYTEEGQVFVGLVQAMDDYTNTVAAIVRQWFSERSLSELKFLRPYRILFMIILSVRNRKCFLIIRLRQQRFF